MTDTPRWRRYLRFFGQNIEADVRVRSAGRRQWFDHVPADARLALRGFRRTPGFFATAVIILGTGIGASVAMFA
ncbi:MAG: hypothetical protein ABJF01_25990, partial [bacterium]